MARDYKRGASAYFDEVGRVLRGIELAAFDKIATALRRCYLSRRRLLICGNGGSGATASHLVADLTKGLYEKHALWWDAHCLSDNTPLILALANDVEYACVFGAQARGLLTEFDSLLAISGSGNSPNVINAVLAAREIGAQTLCLTGSGGGRLAGECDLSLIVPSDDMQIIEDAHMAIGHALFRALRAGTVPA